MFLVVSRWVYVIKLAVLVLCAWVSQLWVPARVDTPGQIPTPKKPTKTHLRDFLFLVTLMMKYFIW